MDIWSDSANDTVSYALSKSWIAMPFDAWLSVLITDVACGIDENVVDMTFTYESIVRTWNVFGFNIPRCTSRD